MMKRRELIIAGVALAAWHPPVIETVLLPAHAETTDVEEEPPVDQPPKEKPPKEKPPPEIEECSDEWDKSSYVFKTNCSTHTVTICNTGDKPALCPIEFDVFFIEKGNPKKGVIIFSGTLPAIGMGCAYINLVDYYSADGNYMVRAFQHSGHKGKGELWSDACTF